MDIIHSPRFQDHTTFVIGHNRRIMHGCLSFKMINPRHHGNYTLIATNEYGTANRSIPYTTMAPGRFIKEIICNNNEFCNPVSHLDLISFTTPLIAYLSKIISKINNVGLTGSTKC